MSRGAAGGVIGITGRMGSGKTTVATGLVGVLASRGQPAWLIDVDNIRRQALWCSSAARHAELRRSLGVRLGLTVQGECRRLDRVALTDLLFTRPEAMAAFTELTVPVFREDIRALIGAFRDRAPGGTVFLEWAMLYEDGYGELADGTAILVTCGERARRERLLSCGMAEPEIRRRLATQPDVDARRASLTDRGITVVTVDTDGSWPTPGVLERVIGMAMGMRT